MNNSVQGYDLDNAGNIYITSQHKPNMEDHKYYPKMIKKIPSLMVSQKSRHQPRPLLPLQAP